ncbi:MAG: MliC family protein [Pseudolabrys sp.]|nr:MliC family protein [Pseudolabrys sp.]
MRFCRALAIGIAGSAWLAQPAAAQGIALYQCADGLQFALAFYEADSHAHIQLNGKSLSLPKRLSLSGSRYSQSGVTLKMGKDATTLKRPREPVTACKPLDKW